MRKTWESKSYSLQLFYGNSFSLCLRKVVFIFRSLYMPSATVNKQNIFQYAVYFFILKLKLCNFELFSKCWYTNYFLSF